MYAVYGIPHFALMCTRNLTVGVSKLHSCWVVNTKLHIQSCVCIIKLHGRKEASVGIENVCTQNVYKKNMLKRAQLKEYNLNVYQISLS